ncbi:adenylate kinase-domain-containing protein [Fimicolochytrium jonesii]|uniref:adenylate kinase-domain-containing protein n=1 Tax=Fimicolochytrium jonesii TaxID=1396493 RepID=UPI0022FDB17E|nr:adenylate kinase-domain-containing protein [Fimicolochytrium jonesii]KAI8822508.1 adenylate kinase-domain-containing protein [Fimicolochytrium jonesii]
MLRFFSPRAVASRTATERTCIVRLYSSGQRQGDQPRRLRALITGSPGAGKGTQTKRLAQKYDITTISSGDLLRKSILDKTPLGLQAQDIIEVGGLVPDDIVIKMILDELDKLRDKNWMLDGKVDGHGDLKQARILTQYVAGFPRTLPQAQTLTTHLEKLNQPLDLVINLDVPEEVIIQRIIDRWIHPASGRTYNMSYNPPKREGMDDITGEPLAKRPDDNVETFKARLDSYYQMTKPLLNYYKEQGTLRSFHGKTSDIIYPQIVEELDRWFK